MGWDGNLGWIGFVIDCAGGECCLAFDSLLLPNNLNIRDSLDIRHNTGTLALSTNRCPRCRNCLYTASLNSAGTGTCSGTLDPFPDKGECPIKEEQINSAILPEGNRISIIAIFHRNESIGAVDFFSILEGLDQIRLN